MKYRLIFTSLIACILIFFAGCHKQEDHQMRIAFSRGSPEQSYASYYNWIHSIDSTVICQDLYALPLDSALRLFRECSGLLLTGGTDVNPAYYGKAYDTARCLPIDHRLDTLEMTLIDSAVAWGMPVLGICRGHQVLNVALGGSLIVDIPTDFGTTVSHSCKNVQSCIHSVTIDTGSILYNISGVSSGDVNSSHHQAVDQISSRLKAIAYASDGLIEAEQWKNPAGQSFLLGVQWHPERLDSGNPLSRPIGVRFLEECRKYK